MSSLSYNSRPHNSPVILSDSNDFTLSDELYSTLSSLQQTKYQQPCMHNYQQNDQYPSIRVQRPNNPFSQSVNHGQSFYGPAYGPQDWQMYQSPSGQTGGYTHSRQFSDSSSVTAGPDSPYTPNSFSPYIANQDLSPSTQNYYGDSSFAFSKGKGYDGYQATQSYVPSQLSHTATAHAALRDMTIDHHNTAGADEVPELFSSRQSNSSHGRNTPNTPRTNVGDESDDRMAKAPANEYQRGHVELYRTESAACQDELYNPANFDTPPSSQPATNNAKPTQNKLLIPQNNLVNDRVKTANDVRSHSPAQQISRERSPFRQGAELAPPTNYPRSPSSTMPSAASIRQRQKEQSDRKEFEAHQPALTREETKTISPKDAVLDAPDFNDQDNSMSLFNDVIPEGYQKHFGGSESYSNNYISGTNQAFGSFVPMNQGQNVGGFRGVDLNNFLQSPMTNDNTFLQAPFGTQESEKPPEFPAHLTSMESSASDNPPVSSQESATSPSARRPSNTSANTGTYTCTYHGCTLRFESPAKLQKHKREVHQPQSTHTSTSPASASPEAEDGAGSSLTSSELLARNSQTGPHKCTRINPTTGKPCNTIFSRPYDLTRHEDTIHNRGKQKVRCQYCREEKTFSRNDALTRHMRVVHPEVDFQGKRGRRDY